MILLNNFNRVLVYYPIEGIVLVAMSVLRFLVNFSGIHLDEVPNLIL
jgi:hypothetical protein